MISIMTPAVTDYRDVLNGNVGIFLQWTQIAAINPTRRHKALAP
jgi:hypothetical protein